MTVARIRALTKQPNRLHAIANNLLGEVIASMDIQADNAIRELQTYPPPVTDQRYIRTYSLMRSWEQTDVHLTQTGLVKTIRNDMPYATFVHGDESGQGQLPMHGTNRRGPPWPLLAEALRNGYVQRLRRAVRKAVEG